MKKMFKCIKCNKEFKYESKLLEHNKRKSPCDFNKNDLECKYCKIKFTCLYNQKMHEKTNKHINNCNNNSKNKVMDIENIVNKYESEIQYYKNNIKELGQVNLILKNENELLKKNNLKLEIVNNNLKNNNKIHHSKEYIYIIHCIQHIDKGIYKIGRTKNITNRLKQYPKGSELLFTIMVDNSRKIETDILNYLKNNENYIQYTDSGNEYFRCDLNILKKDIYNIIDEFEK